MEVLALTMQRASLVSADLDIWAINARLQTTATASCVKMVALVLITTEPSGADVLPDTVETAARQETPAIASHVNTAPAETRTKATAVYVLLGTAVPSARRTLTTATPVHVDMVFVMIVWRASRATAQRATRVKHATLTSTSVILPTPATTEPAETPTEATHAAAVQGSQEGTAKPTLTNATRTPAKIKACAPTSQEATSVSVKQASRAKTVN